MTGVGSHADTRDMYMVHTALRREFGALPNLVRTAASVSFSFRSRLRDRHHAIGHGGLIT
jgi:hypothetical protein